MGPADSYQCAIGCRPPECREGIGSLKSASYWAAIIGVYEILCNRGAGYVVKKKSAVARVAVQPLAGAVSWARPTRYDPVSQVFHWLTAVLIFALIPLGLIASSIGDGIVRSTILDQWHKPMGITVLVLSLVRFWWRTRVTPPVHAAGVRRWEITTSRLVHVLIYLLLLMMPLSGLMMSQGAGRPISYFGLFTLPQLLPIDPSLAPRQQLFYRLGKQLHEGTVAWGLYAALALHIGAVVKHQIIDQNRYFLARMWGFGR